MYSTHSFWLPKCSKVELDKETMTIRITMPYPSGDICFYTDESGLSNEELLQQFHRLYFELITPKVEE